ncbi:MAG: hypothetical protein AAF824_10150 [Bacteroidota bacterium]
MKYLPYDHVILHRPLSISQIQERINKYLSDSSCWKVGQGAPNTYKGSIYDHHFKISRIIETRFHPKAVEK